MRSRLGNRLQGAIGAEDPGSQLQPVGGCVPCPLEAFHPSHQLDVDNPASRPFNPRQLGIGDREAAGNRRENLPSPPRHHLAPDPPHPRQVGFLTHRPGRKKEQRFVAHHAE